MSAMPFCSATIWMRMHVNQDEKPAGGRERLHHCCCVRLWQVSLLCCVNLRCFPVERNPLLVHAEHLILTIATS
jgi:hypothetical protein